MRGVLGSVALLLASLAVAALLSEFVLRLRFDEVDYLEPRLESHPVLRHVIVPGSGDHDAWGFRNPGVPERVEILAIGDSQTYGVSAPARDSWPSRLGEFSGRSVYNLSLPGYGPPDYHYLLREFGLSLEPEVAVIGFYFGNDLPRAGAVAEGRTRPSRALRGGEDGRLLGGLRSWLSQHSLLYQVVKFEVPGLADALRLRESAGREDAISLAHPVGHTHLTPAYRFAILNQAKTRNRRGLDATLAVFAEIAATCAESGIRCIYLLIPTKESVYWHLVREGLAGTGYDQVSKLVAQEDAVRARLVRSFEARGIEWIDPLPALRRAAGRMRIYPASADGHPNAAGYRVIAQSVLEGLDGGGSR